MAERKTSSRTKRTPKASSSRKSTAASSRRKPSRSPAKKRKAATRKPAAKRSGVAGTVKSAAGKAKIPVVAAGAVAGIAGGILLRARSQQKSVLGVKVPTSLPDFDAKSIAKTVGQASKRFARTSKNVSKDLDRAGDQAERIGKILD